MGNVLKILSGDIKSTRKLYVATKLYTKKEATTVKGMSAIKEKPLAV